MLEHLGDIDWEQLEHAYGQAGDVPDLLRALMARGRNKRENALESLFMALCHQGTVAPATAPAVPFLLELAASPEVKGRPGLLQLLASITSASGYPEAQACLEAVWKGWPVIRSLCIDPGRSLRRAARLLAGALLRQPHPAAAGAAADLLGLLADDTTPERAGLLALLGQAVAARSLSPPEEPPALEDAESAEEDLDLGYEPGPPRPAATDQERQWDRDLQAVVWGGWQLLRSLSEQADPELRLAALFTLAALLRHGADARPVATLAREWMDELTQASEEKVAASLVFALAAVAGSVPEVQEVLRRVLIDSPSKLVRFVTALKLVDLEGDVDERGAALLLQAWQHPQELLPALRQLPPWDRYDPLPRLKKLGPRVVERYADVFVAMIAGCRGHFSAGPAQAALDLAFAGRPFSPRAGGQLSEAQRRILLACVDNGTFWGRISNDDLPLERHGLPASRAELRRLLARHGEPPPPPPSDVQAAGILFDQLAAGELPFQQEDETAAVLEGTTDDPPSPARQIQATVDRLRRIEQGYTRADRKRIRQLELCGHASDALLTHVAGCPRLRKLDLYCGEATDAGMVHLANLTELEELDLNENNITDAGLAHLRKLKKLRILRLQVEAITDDGLAALAGLKRLRVLDLNRTRITGPGLAHLARLELRELWLGGPHLTDAVFPPLAALTALRKLRLAAPNVHGRGLQHLASLKELRQLELDRSGLVDEGLQELLLLPALKELRLEETSITEAGLAAVSGQTKLTRLDLSSTRVGDGVLEVLAPLAGLKELDLSGTSITDAALTPLPHFRKLRRLNLGRTRITDAAIEMLQQMSRLEWLGLAGSSLSAEGIARLQQARPELPMWV